MTDVRLTATNPEDSSVVPVACNAKGELKLEEVPTFDGNVDGDLTVSGSATFAGKIDSTGSLIGISTDATYNVATDYSYLSKGALVANRATTNTDAAISVYSGGNVGDPAKAVLKADGSAEFASGKFTVNSNGRASSIGSIGGFHVNDINQTNAAFAVSDSNGINTYCTIMGSGSATFAGNVDAKAALDINKGGSKDGNNSALVVWNNSGSTYSVNIKGNGAANFAGNKAGFTAEGYLWCTTRRGDTVILDATSNGLASWVPYTPPSRLTELQDRWAEKDGILPVPHDSSQDEPETPQ